MHIINYSGVCIIDQSNMISNSAKKLVWPISSHPAGLCVTSLCMFKHLKRLSMRIIFQEQRRLSGRRGRGGRRWRWWYGRWWHWIQWVEFILDNITFSTQFGSPVIFKILILTISSLLLILNVLHLWMSKNISKVSFARYVSVCDILFESIICTFHIYRSTAFECNIKYALSKQLWRSGNVQVVYRSYKYWPNAPPPPHSGSVLE